MGQEGSLSETLALYGQVLRRTRPYVGLLIVGIAGVLLESSIEVLKPWPLKVVIDNVLRGTPLNLRWISQIPRGELLVAACLGLVSIYVTLGIMSVANNYLTISIGQRMVSDFRADLFDHLQRLSLSFHRRREIGDLMVRITFDTFSIQTIAMNGFFPAVASLVLLAGMFAVMIRMDPVLTFVSLAVVPFLFMLIGLISRRINRLNNALLAKESRLYTVAHGALAAIHVVQAFTRESESYSEFVKSSSETLDENLRLYTVQTIYSGAVNVLIALGTAAVIYLGARHVMEGVLTIGDLIVFSIYLASLYGPVNQIFQTYGQVKGAQAGLRRCFELLALDPEIKDRPEARALGRACGEIEFDNVIFSYEPGQTLLKRISFTAHAGQRIAIVGPSGAGKTTLTALLARFYDPQGGAIRIDGVDIREATLASLRGNIAMVMQPPLVVGGTLGLNIAFGKSPMTEAQIDRAARMARLGPLLEKLPNRLAELVGPGGHTLSEGEAQRVTIARALLKNAPILIMDEPTSALDSETESLVLGAVEEAMHGRTTLIIAHRLATIRNADRILVLRDGVIEESGTFEELRARGGFFNHLYQMQTWGEETRKHA
ncbi:MAG: ABC transporter ATP-binding protein [Candidatus Binataceae bacterium]